MAKTIAQQIAAVEAAIEQAESAQSLSSADGRSLTSANLDRLYNRLDQLLLRQRWNDNGRVRCLEVP